MVTIEFRTLPTIPVCAAQAKRPKRSTCGPIRSKKEKSAWRETFPDRLGLHPTTKTVGRERRKATRFACCHAVVSRSPAFRRSRRAVFFIDHFTAMVEMKQTWGLRYFVVFIASVACIAWELSASDWSRFRGPNGSGIAKVNALPPTQWSNAENLRWAVDLPGPGHSSPIVVGDKVFVTCWTGYGTDRQSQGSLEDLKRHLLCIDLKSGKTLWRATVDAKLPEDRYQGMFAEHGYASHTPVSDGQRVFCFFGKSGVFAFDLDGQQLWNVDVGDGLDPRQWGSASSLMFSGELLIVTAGPESGSLFGLNKQTGEVVWKQEVALNGMWGTPIVATVDTDRTDLIIAVPNEIWGLNPENGKLRWYCDGIRDGSMNSSPVLDNSVVYAIDGRGGDAVAVRIGGLGDVTQTNIVWQKDHRGRISSPVVHDGRMYWVAGGVLNCVDASSGERIYQQRLGPEPSGGGRGRGSRGGQDYSSPVVAGDQLYFFNRQGVGFVVRLGEEFQQIATNRFDDPPANFSGTPAIVDGTLLVRSTAKLYCIGQ